MIDEWERKSSIANCLSPLRVNSVAERLYYRAVASRSPWPFVISPDGQREHVFRCHIATTHWHSLTCRVFCILFLAFPSGSRRAIFASQWNSKRYAPRDLLISNNFQQTWTIKYVTIFQDTQNQHTKHLIYYNHAKWTWFNGHQHSTNVRRLEQTKECSSAFYYYYTLKSSDSFAGRSSIHNIHEYRRHHTLYISFFFYFVVSSLFLVSGGCNHSHRNHRRTEEDETGNRESKEAYSHPILPNDGSETSTSFKKTYSSVCTE